MASLNVTYNEYSAKLNSGLHQLLETAHNADVTFAVEGRFIKAHQIILSMFSTYFEELFAANPCPHPIFFMKDVSYHVMKDILRFMYAGEAQVAQEDIHRFIETASALKVKALSGINESTSVPGSSSQKCKNEPIVNNMLSLNHLTNNHDMQVEEESNKALHCIPKESFHALEVLKSEPNDNSSDFEESQGMFSTHSETHLQEESEFFFNHDNHAIQEYKMNEGNKNVFETVTFVKTKRGRAIIVDNFRYSAMHGSKTRNTQPYICTKSARKCPAQVVLTDDGHIIHKYKHLCQLSANRYSWENDKIVEERTYRVATLQEFRLKEVLHSK